MKLRCLLLGLFFLLIQLEIYCQEFKLKGIVVDQTSSSIIPGAKITIAPISKKYIATTSGEFETTLPTGSYTISIQSYDYKKIEQKIEFTKDTLIEFKLSPNLNELTQVEVNAKTKENTNSTKIGQIELQMAQVKTLPSFMGEVDILKTIQLLPGVSSVSEGGQGFYVRGGGPDQNLVLVDNVPVYNASHLFGFFSVFNADAVKSGNLIKGTIPANHGGRMSSVLEISTNEGDASTFHLKGGIGLISSRLLLEGPLIKKNKGAFMIAGRRTYIDVLAKPFIPSSSPFAGSGYYFYDLNFNANYQFSKKNKLFLTAYKGVDEFSYVNKTDEFNVKIPWGNSLISLRWNTQLSSKLILNATSYFTKYDFSFGSEQTEFSIKLSSGIYDFGEKIDFTYLRSETHKIKWGLDYIYHTFTPSSLSATQKNTVLNTGKPQELRSHETSVYLNDEYDFTPKFRLNSGIRFSSFLFTGPFTRINNDKGVLEATKEYSTNEPISLYPGIEPRISARYLIGETSSLKFGMSYNYQYVHLTSLSALSLPTDIWYPTTDIAKPQKGYQISLGYFKNFLDNLIETSIETYFKGMDNLIEFKPGALPGSNFKENLDNLLTFGSGRSYGAEFFIRKNQGKFTGWIGYTIAKTERLFKEIQPTYFPAKYDRRHDLTLVGTYKFNDHWTFSTAFVFATGNTLTLPSSWYLQDQNLIYQYNERNSTRMESYHRLDISATWYDKATRKKFDLEKNEFIELKKRFRNSVNISIYNVYNRLNPFFLYLRPEGYILNNNFKLAVRQVSLFPIIPSVTWNFEF